MYHTEKNLINFSGNDYKKIIKKLRIRKQYNQNFIRFNVRFHQHKIYMIVNLLSKYLS